MFKTITRLLFGGEEQQAPEDVKSGEVVEEEWHVVSHQEAGSAGNPGAELTDTKPFTAALPGDAVTNMETDVSAIEPESTDQSSGATSRAIAASVSEPKALLEATEFTCTQKAKTWTDQHHMTRNAIQRQNRVRQGVQHHFFHLQQPGHRNLSH